ncbi:MAG: ATP-binding protein, partial [Proteobacteria bacterium]|nr:ATP-binding protein [Pseudomonadota bacterium]
MSQVPTQIQQQEPPAMGERRARWGYGYQDKIATERILNLLRKNLRERGTLFEGVRLADLDAGRVDDFVLVWGKKVEGNSIKWSREATPLNWGELMGANGLLKELADGYQRLKDRWPGKAVSVRLQSNRPPSPEKHHAQLISTLSVAEFVRDHWPSGPTSHDSAQVTAVWSKISEHVSLTGADFSEFVNSCNFSLGYPEPPGSGPDSQDWRHYKKQFEDLHKAIATWLTNNPHSDFIDRFFLLSAIGFRGNRSGMIQRFPLPKIPYSKNGTSADQLKQLIDTTGGGYIAVVGPAGIGKSTLVQDVLSNAQYPFFIPYYAFLPDTDGNRDRGEALTFFQDVIGRLDKFFTHRYSLGISDIAQGREALREHMSKANEQYIIQGHKAILLIDGLDHVSQEINLQNTLLQELPSPDEVPDGFLIILSSQPQALIPGTITAQVGNVVPPQSDRRIEVSGLARPEVHEILEKIDKTTTGLKRDALYNASIGNPLILTYLLNLFQRTPETTVEEAVALAGNYAGDIVEYYQSRLSIPLQGAQTRHLLGLLCRAAPTIPVEWLQEWPERFQFENIYDHILAPFVQVEDGNLQFIHNSLIAFLKSGTRSRLPGADLSADERNFHSALADRCGNRPCVDPLGRARVLHLLRANRNNDLLSVLSSDWLRQAIEAFLPYALIRPLLLSGLGAAWNLGELGQVLRLILLGHELDQRTSRLEAGDLAETLLGLDKPELAVSQIRALGRLLVEDNVALGFAHSLWQYADDHNRQELKNTARTLYMQAKPVSFF